MRSSVRQQPMAEPTESLGLTCHLPSNVPEAPSTRHPRPHQGGQETAQSSCSPGSWVLMEPRNALPTPNSFISEPGLVALLLPPRQFWERTESGMGIGGTRGRRPARALRRPASAPWPTAARTFADTPEPRVRGQLRGAPRAIAGFRHLQDVPLVAGHGGQKQCEAEPRAQEQRAQPGHAGLGVQGTEPGERGFAELRGSGRGEPGRGRGARDLVSWVRVGAPGRASCYIRSEAFLDVAPLFLPARQPHDTPTYVLRQMGPTSRRRLLQSSAPGDRRKSQSCR